MSHHPEYKKLGYKKVLLVEDVELNQFLARHIMESWGFEVDIAVNGKEAIIKVEAGIYDIILMDIQMPEMDGVEATRRIRQMNDPVKAAIPIIALTANTRKADIDRYMEVGMNDCLAKPYDESRLFKIVSNTLMNDLSATEIAAEPASSLENPVIPKYDLSMVNSLSGGDQDFVKRMVRLFLDTMPSSLNELQAACSREDWKSVGKSAHKMKSTIDSMGMKDLKDLIRQLELNGRNNQNIENIPEQVKLVTAGVELCMTQVRKDFDL